MSFVIDYKALGLYGNINELESPDGALSVADNVLITKDDVIESRPAFEACQNGLPAAKPLQMFTGKGLLFTHIDNRIFYKDASSCSYTALSSGVGDIIYPRSIQVDGNNLYILENVFPGDTYNLRAANILSEYVYTIRAGMNIPNMRCFTVDGTLMYYCKYVPANPLPTTVELRKIDLSTGTDTLIAGSSYGHVDNTGALAKFYDISGIIFDSTDIYTMSSSAVRKIVKATGVVTTPLGSNTGGFTDGIGAAAALGCLGLASDGTSWFTTQSFSNQVYMRKINPATWAMTTPGGGSTIAYDNTTPSNVAVDSTYMYFMTATSGFRVLRFNKTTGAATVLAGAPSNPGSAGYVDGNDVDARFNFDNKTCSDKDFTVAGFCSAPACWGGFTFIPDFNNQVIRRFNPGPNQVITYLGNAMSPASTDGSYSQTSIMGPA